MSRRQNGEERCFSAQHLSVWKTTLRKSPPRLNSTTDEAEKNYKERLFFILDNIEETLSVKNKPSDSINAHSTYCHNHE